MNLNELKPHPYTIFTRPIFLPFVLLKKNWPGNEASVSPDISVDSHVILYNEWVCDEWWFTCSHYLDSVQDGYTALYVAAHNGHVEAVGLLIAAKANVNVQQKVRFTACLSVSNYLDVYRMVGLHCTRPVRMVTVKLSGCWWWPRLTSASRIMWVTLHDCNSPYSMCSSPWQQCIHWLCVIDVAILLSPLYYFLHH